jgi:hypothetical protein
LNDKDIVLTKEGLEKLELELDELKTAFGKPKNLATSPKTPSTKTRSKSKPSSRAASSSSSK